jgi:hypothetical protein
LKPQPLLFRHDVHRPGVRGGQSWTASHRPFRVVPALRRTLPGQALLPGIKLPDPEEPGLLYKRLPKRALTPREVRLTQSETNPYPDSPLVVSYGAGVDSTAILVKMVKRGIRPDAILFADTGGEKEGTMAFLPVMQRYLEAHGFPGITVVRMSAKNAKYSTIVEKMLANETIPFFPGKAHTCSQVFKIEPQLRWIYSWDMARKAWAANKKITHIIGYDSGQYDTGRAADTFEECTNPDREQPWYPLQAWKMDRAECIKTIIDAGLPVPPKSSCYICPVMKPEEIRELAEQDPARAALALAVEDVAIGGKHGMRKMPQGLGMSAGAPWRTTLEQYGRVVEELHKLPEEQRHGTDIGFEEVREPHEAPKARGQYRTDIDKLTPELLARLAYVARQGRVMLTPGSLERSDPERALMLASFFTASVKRVFGPSATYDPRVNRHVYVEVPGQHAPTQTAALALVERLAPLIRHLIDRQVRVLVPILPGPRPLGAVWKHVAETLGSTDFSCLVPETADASALAGLAQVRPSGIHLAGKRPKALAHTLRDIAPQMGVSGDELVKAATVRGALFALRHADYLVAKAKATIAARGQQPVVTVKPWPLKRLRTASHDSPMKLASKHPWVGDSARVTIPFSTVTKSRAPGWLTS